MPTRIVQGEPDAFGNKQEVAAYAPPEQENSMEGVEAIVQSGGG